jgi:Rieske Fe-S protein
MDDHPLTNHDEEPRRSFVASTSVLMAAGMAAGYGTFGSMLARFVYPAKSAPKGWLFVCPVEDLAVGQALDFITSAGAKVVIARQSDGIEASDFLALSSVCPHLGCRVHWEGAHDRFFCPCHNGAFDREGQPTEGPPKAARQALVRFPLRVENGLLFLEAPLTTLVAATPTDSERVG